MQVLQWTFQISKTGTIVQIGVNLSQIGVGIMWTEK